MCGSKAYQDGSGFGDITNEKGNEISKKAFFRRRTKAYLDKKEKKRRMTQINGRIERQGGGDHLEGIDKRGSEIRWGRKKKMAGKHHFRQKKRNAKASMEDQGKSWSARGATNCG